MYLCGIYLCWAACIHGGKTHGGVNKTDDKLANMRIGGGGGPARVASTRVRE